MRDVLEVFGALDHESFGPRVDKFLPGSSANTGWYSELEKFLYGDNAKTTPPDLYAALQRIADADEQASNEADGRRLNQVQKARLLFALGTVAHLNQFVPEASLPSLTNGDHIQTAKNALAAVGPGSFDLQQRREKADNDFDLFITNAKETFASKRDFPGFRKTQGVVNELIGKETSETALCDTSVISVRGIESVVVETVGRSDEVTLNNLKKIIHPLNWPQNSPDFFLSMAENGAELPQGWHPVLEKVCLIPDLQIPGFEMTTPLKYRTCDDPVNPSEAHVDYDFDESRFDSGDHKVRVDRGFINMLATSPGGNPALPGVRVRTIKVVHIEGISPFLQERLVCVSGYGTFSSNFLFGPALNPPAAAVPFTGPAANERAPAAQPAAGAPAQPGGDSPTPTPHAVPGAVMMWTDTLQDLTTDYVGLAEKWCDGALNMTDIVDFSKRVGGKLASAPLEFLQAMNKPRYPGN